MGLLTGAALPGRYLDAGPGRYLRQRAAEDRVGARRLQQAPQVRPPSDEAADGFRTIGGQFLTRGVACSLTVRTALRVTPRMASSDHPGC